MTAENQQADLASGLKQVLRYLPAPVGIVSSYDTENGQPIGLAMSAIMPVALEPCSMAIAVNRSGSAHEGMLRAGKYCINLLDSELHGHMAPFASAEARDGWANADSSGGYERELALLFATLRVRSEQRTIWLTTDVHFAVDVRLRALVLRLPSVALELFERFVLARFHQLRELRDRRQIGIRARACGAGCCELGDLP